MLLKKIQLNNFRNFSNAELEFQDDINVISGPNGAGKSNLLESIYLVGIGRSFRRAKNKDLINWDKDWARIEAEAMNEEYKIVFKILSNGEKEVTVNGAKLPKLSDLIGNISETYVGPAEINLIKGSPSLRRKMLNVHLAQVDSEYIESLKNYKKVLANRNSVLKELRDGDMAGGKVLLLSWNEELVKYGKYIVRKRARMLTKLRNLSDDLYAEFTTDADALDLKYDADVDFDDLEDIEESFQKTLEENIDKEIERGYTLSGPHRDDITFELNGKDVNRFSSWGEARTVSIAVLLSLAKLLADRFLVKPIILLDDCFAELDERRTRTLLELSPEIGQVFLTTPKKLDVPYNETKSFNIERKKDEQGRQAEVTW